MKRIGIVGGSFNPIHERHLELGLSALKERKLDHMIFLPTGNPPHKREGLEDGEHRWEMTCLAVSGLENCSVSRCELDREGTIYTVDTLTILKKQYPDAQFEYVIGEDTLRDLPNWRSPDEVFKLCTFVVCCRSHENLEKDEIVSQLQQRGARFAFLTLPPRDVSSTAVRDSLARGQVPPELSPQVMEYIRIFGLYGVKPSPEGFMEWYPLLKSVLSPKRLVHSLCVSFCARELAGIYHVSEEKAALAGLLHDCAKCIPLEEMQNFIQAGKQDVDVEIYGNGNLLHGYAGAVRANREFHTEDEEILDAIRTHTTGRPGMSTLEMILFLADKMEPSRKSYPELENIRSLVARSLIEAMKVSLQSSADYVAGRGERLHPSTLKTLEWLKNQTEKQKERNKMRELALKIAEILYEKKAWDIVALDVTGMTIITDCMVIASGRNALQVRALADEVEDRMSELGYEPRRKEGQQDGLWAVLDYEGVLVHIFHTEQRDFYRLDKLWETEANRIPLPFEKED